MSACMRSLYSSDQWAPGFSLLLSLGPEVGSVLLSLGDFRAPVFSLRMDRGEAGLEGEFELFMQLLGTYCGLLRLSCHHNGIVAIGYDVCISFIARIRPWFAGGCSNSSAKVRKLRECAGDQMAVIQLIDSRKRDLGGFVVRRVLPAETRQMVGPFIFFDHLGPVRFQPGEGIDVRPHPHIALATVTYLFAGSLLHRDSLGSVQEIKPGDVNWMSAGEGIVHSERTPPESRPQGPHVHGIQSWVALPDGMEEGKPTFAHTAAAALPHLKLGEATLAVIAGHAFGAKSPVEVLWPTLYVDAQLPPKAMLEIPPEYAERAVYAVEGRLSIGDTQLDEGQLAILKPGATVPVRAVSASRMLLLGGEAFATPRFIEWNFVASSRERIDRAKRRWRAQEFPAVPGETEFIPLP